MFLRFIVRLHGFETSRQLLISSLCVFWFRVSVGRPKHIRVMAGALEGDVFIGRRAQEFRGLLKIKYPMEHGIVTDWDDMERIWSWVYAEELGTLSEEVSPLALLLRSGRVADIRPPLVAPSFTDGSTFEPTK